jgi:hypothetical protein
MRLIDVSMPLGRSADVAQIAFSSGIERVSIQQEDSRLADGSSEIKEIVKIQTSTPKGKQFVDALLKADFYDPDQISFAIRAPRSIISREGLREITVPLPETATDILEELFLFSHVTYSLVGRVFIAGLLLAYGMIQQQLLLMIAGLLFLPLLPLLQAVGFGAWTRQWKLSLQGLLAFVISVILLILAGALVAALSSPPLRYDEFSALGVSFLISLVVGVAAGLAIIDDGGKREMIGLAASAQIALVPVWFGICAVFGFPTTTAESEISSRAVSFFINVLTLIAASLAVHIFAGTAGSGALTHLKK